MTGKARLQHLVTIARGAAQLVGDGGAMLLPQQLNALSGFGRFGGDFSDAAQKEGQPALPFAAITHTLQMVASR